MIEGKTMTKPQGIREQAVGPFEYDEAVQNIRKFALALTNLDLNDRFAVSPTPRAVLEREKRRDRKAGRKEIYYQVVIIDKRPDEPRPTGLTALHIAQAEAQGYTKPRTRQYHEAFGQTKTLNQWAKAVGVTYPTLKSRIDRGMTVEEAVTEIAIKKAA